MTKTTKAVAMLGMVAALGVAALPLSTYAETKTDGETPATQDVNVSLTIDDMLEISIETTDVVLEGEGTGAQYNHETPVKIDVDTTVTEGFKLTMIGSTDKGSSKTALFNEEGKADHNVIAGTGFSSTTGTTSAWGYQKNALNDTFSSTTWDAIPSAAADITESDVAAKKTAYVKFAAYVAPGQEAGTYEGKVTFTATANPAS